MKRHALFVGINDYADKAFKNLRYSLSDALALSVAFGRKGFETDILSNPKSEEILNAVERATAGLGPGDVFLFFFAGHGYTADGSHLLICADDKLSLLRYNRAGIPVELLEEVTNGRGFHRAFLLDACRTDVFAGVDSRGAETRDLALVSLPDAKANAGTCCVLRSCDRFCPAMEFEDLGHGVFTRAVMDVVGDDSACATPFGEAFVSDLRSRMRDIIAAHGVPADQNPCFQTNGEAFFLFDAPANARLNMPPPSTPVIATPLVVCPVCNEKNRPEDTFKCRECGRDNLCLRHQNEETFLCRDCARKARAAAPKKPDGQYNESVDGLTWNFKVENGKAIIGYRDGNTPIPATAVKPEGHVDIPPVLGGCPVTHVGDCAFWGCGDITRLTIPDSVEGVEFHAFYNCSEDIFDSASIPGIKLLDGWVVGVASGNPTSLDLKLARGICGGAFKGCRNLTSVTLPSGTKSIGDATFAYCNLTSVTLPTHVTSIGCEAFHGCKGLKSLTIPGGVTSIGDYAFWDCGLTSMTIPTSVTSIGDGAFCGCDHLTSVAIPDSVTSIGKRAFESSGIVSVTLPKNVTSIEDGVFYDCGDLMSVVLPASLTRIGDFAFTDCHRLQSLRIPNSVKSIERGAFFRCSALDAKTKAMLKSRWPDCIE